MTTFVMVGKYTIQAMEEVSSERTKSVENYIKTLGGKIKDIYVLLGEYDLVLIVELPSEEKAIQASLGLSKITNINFTTYPAISAENFDQMAHGLGI
ncbi:MAG: GYD domain-containing protein [Desulfohalobiaceae bacterium]|nr:GYD domain-containing protein [Desulfohalobiaceae bacterium]